MKVLIRFQRTLFKMISVRRFSTTAVQFKRILPAFPTQKTAKFKKSVSFEKNFPVHERVKAWEKTGEDKETYFKRKHAHHHAKQLKWEEEHGISRRGKKVKKDDTDYAMKSKNGKKSGSRDDKRHRDDDFSIDRSSEQGVKFEKRNIYSGLRPSPLSDYLFGSSAVYAALKSQKRGFYTKLLIFNYKLEDQRIIDLANKLKIPIKEVKNKNELNILTNNGVHNGIVLETKPLLPQLIKELGKYSNEDGKYQVGYDDLGELVPSEKITSNPFPLGVYLDEVSDPHNVGAIIRSAYFLGADFIVLSGKNCANITPTVVKTSSGASEFIPIYSTESPLSFLGNSKTNGWSIISSGQASHPKNSTINKTLQEKALHFQDLDQLLIKTPVLLVVGSEGEGIRTTMKLKSDHIVEIESGAHTDPIIDSLNVSVASALMIKQLMSY